ncbi:MAG TPA: NAD(P)/FAD-dependent oxidoreductase [Bryobacteraceae bacterium]|nr:NAD(P)/FAD-dependent oxidoreductase [Bryobacteraceae bacterium]
MKKSAEVIGAGPNGLAAAILLARAGCAVRVHEAAERPGGGLRSEGLTLPGFVHDVCSGIHAMAPGSPCFEQFHLAEHGLEWIHPEAPLAHPLDDGTAVVVERSVDETAARLGPDGAAWRELIGPFAARWGRLRYDVLAPLLRVPHDPVLMARFGLYALQSAEGLARGRFRGVRARALFAGLAAHSIMPLDRPASAAVGMVMGITAHVCGWPFPRGGAQSLTDALVNCLRALGGEVITGSQVTEVPEADVVMCDVTPRQLRAMAGDRFPDDFRRRLERFEYGPGVFKVDYALDAPVPWRARECARAGTVHLGGTLEEIAEWEGGFAGLPFVLGAQHTLFDPTRAPAGRHTFWAYCHVPNGSTADMTNAIEEQIERFAPGFRNRILARHAMGPAELERRNPNLVGGDIAGGAMTLRQMFLRPTAMVYRTPLAHVFLCSASTPPGGGVHGMCGFHAVRNARFPVA